jgi:putative FmdB family regulatory protein
VPVYVYRRRDGSTFETQQRMGENPLVDCPSTGQTVERVLQPFTPRFSGTGSTRLTNALKAKVGRVE